VKKFDTSRKYRNVLILESRDWDGASRDQFDPALDLVLTYDFALKKEIDQLEGNACYIDHLVDKRAMHENNSLIYHFFGRWHYDSSGNDIFIHRGVPFGFAFRQQIWNDFTSYVRNRICLERLRELTFEQLLVGQNLEDVERIFEDMGLSFSPVSVDAKHSSTTYYFPAFQWIDEKIRARSAKHVFRDVVTTVQSIVRSWIDRILGKSSVPGVFVQEYYPTRDLLQRMKRDASIRLVLAHFSWSSNILKYVTERPIPIWGRLKMFQAEAARLMQDFRRWRCCTLILANGVDITDCAYRVIERRVAEQIAHVLLSLDCVINYLDRHPIKLAVLIANIGLIACLVDCVCRAKGISTYLIINGLMSGEFADESKYANVINSYSESIKEHYFRGMDNIVCLGDPRMDAYACERAPRVINRNSSTITIGTSAYSPIDLNSYQAVEFEFMHDVLSALQVMRGQGAKVKVVIKVRANGYRKQYQTFVQEYFPGLVDKIVDVIPFRNVLEQTDCYITTYSQTLFEASCLGIPCIYYKNDCEILDPPFDTCSELVTVESVVDLVQALVDFRSGHERFNPFLQPATMGKYIGPLDGGNLKRNLECIRMLLRQDGYDIALDKNRALIQNLHKSSLVSTDQMRNSK